MTVSPAATVTREQVQRFRVRAQEIGSSGPRADAAVLDLGVQDTGPDGARWALVLRGADPTYDGRVLLWTLRGAPHLYRRDDVAGVAAATAPFSEADAARRVLDAARPLRAAGIPVLEALDEVAAQMRAVVTGPTVKGEMSRLLSERLPAPYLRECRPCAAVHAHEQSFRLSALRAGLELEPGTSPPVLRRVEGWSGPAAEVPARLDVVRGVLRFLGPATPQHVAGYLDAPVRDVEEHWPDDVVAVHVEGEPARQRRSLLAPDLPALTAAEEPGGVRLLGPFDLLLQGRDRELVVPDEAARKDVWRTLGRPGAVLAGSALVGTWRPRSSGRRLRLEVALWDGRAAADVPGLAEEAERLATFRGQAFEGFC